MSIIQVEDVSMRFNLAQEKTETLKEYTVKLLKHQLFFNEFYALRDISFKIEPGESVALIGRNGSGKSTMLKLIAGVMYPTTGSVTVNGEIAPLIELGAGFDLDLTARENVFLNGAVLGHDRAYMQEHFQNIIDFAELWDFVDVPVKNYSSGMIARLGFSIATEVRADILACDEILSVGDFMFQQKCHQRMEQMLSGGTTLLFVSHDINQVKQLCKRAIWIDHGHLRGDGPAEEVCNAYVAAMERGEKRLPPRGKLSAKRTDEGQTFRGSPLAGNSGTAAPHPSVVGATDTFSLRAKSRLRRLRSDTRLRAQPQGGRHPSPSKQHKGDPMLTKKQNLTREILTVILLLAAVAATEYWFFQLWRLDWHVPMFYGGDGIYWVGQVQRSYGELSGSLGWPFYEVAGRYDPNYDLIYDIFVWFVGLFTKDTGTVFNLYVLVIPFANALAGYAVFRMVGLRRWLSFAFGLTFGLTPYVQQRMAGHMMLAACEFVPFSVLLCLWCAEDEQFNRPGRGFFKNKRNWLALAMAWGIANNGAAYYPYFTCFFLCVTALCLILRDRRWRAGTSCVVTIAEIVAWMIPDFFPMVLGILNGQGSTLTNGVYRSPVGADIYSLRISSLLLSPNGFGLQKLANWMGRYFHVLATDEGPMYNENAYGYLGIVGIFGFLALLLMLLRSRDWKAGRTERPELGDRLWLLSRLNVMALLLATIAGFGGIIGIFVRFIRGYNRISPYIAFFALLAVGLALEKQLTRHTGRSRKALAAVAILLLGYGYWEQQGFFRPAYEEIQDKWYQDEAFMNEVEAAAGDGAMLFTLPYMKNFENGSLNNMWDYTLLRGPLHSKTLKFTYGAGYGTKNDLWYRETSELEPDAMVAELRTQGMTGIYLDLDGYPEDEQQSALAALTEAAGCGPEDVIHSGSGLLCYIPLGQE